MSESEGKNPLVYLFGRMWKYSEGNRKIVILYLLMLIVSEIINTFWTPIVMANMMNVVESEGVTESSLKKLLVLLALLPVGSALSWLFHGPARYMEECNAFLARAKYSEHQLQGVMNLPLEWHNEHHTGDTIDKIEKGSSSIYEFSSETFQFVKPVIKLFGCVGAVIYFSNVSAIIVVGIMLLGVLITIKIDSICGALIREISKKENIISESIHDAINNISTVITLRVEKPVFDSIVHKIMSPFEPFRRNNRLNETKWSLVAMCCSIMTVLVYLTYFLEHKNSQVGISTGSFFLVVNYLEKISELFYQFTGLYGWTIRRKFRLQNGELLSKDFKQTSFTNHLLPKDWRELRVENLTFSYNTDNGSQHLDDISFALHRGEKIAVVGETGSGKSTLLKVIRDLYHPQEGRLFVDGSLIPTGFEGISRAISLVQQDPEIFERSIRENITLGAEYDDQKIEQYAEVACFAGVALSLPKSYDSLIKEKGVNLSGGQVQRLALTRGLLASDDKDIVLLDEPTSSLDPATATTVFSNILNQFRKKTVMSSVHTLQILPMFDRVFMFSKGKIVGMGTIADLLANCPEFAEMWRKQFDATA